jgi:hypothetical protein
MIIALIVLAAGLVAFATASFPVPDPSAWADEQARLAKLR